MKKFISVVSVMFLVVALIGCGEVALSRGTIEDGVYRSDISGLTFTIPDNWYAVDDAQIKEAYSYSSPTNAELQETKGLYYFLDATFWDSTQGKNVMSIYYTTIYNGITDEQLKTRKSAEVSNVTFGEVSYFEIGEIKWAKIHGEGTDRNYYFAWRCDVSKGPREVLYIQTTDTETCDILLSGLSYS